MTPQADYRYSHCAVVYLVNKAVLDIDPAGIQSVEVAQQLFTAWWRFVWIFTQYVQ